MRNKKLICSLLSAALVMSMFPGITLADTAGVEINEANFPEMQFRDLVLGYDTDGNRYLSDAEIAKVTKIDVGGEDFNDLTGIEYFTSLTELICHSDNLHTLDLSHNTALKILDCCDNSLEELDLSNNTELTSLNCSSCRISSLDLSHNTALVYLNLAYCDIECLDLSKNTKLEYLNCHGNEYLTNLKISNCTSLKYLDCSFNDLNSLDITNNTELNVLSFVENVGSVTLNIGNNSSLISLYNLDPIIVKYGFIYGNEITEDEYYNMQYSFEYDEDDEGTCYFSSALFIDDSINLVIEPTPTPTPVPTEAPKSSMVSFAERLYTEALNRNYDKAGRDYWVSQLRSGVSGAEVARQFFFSEEFINANLSDEVFVDRLYGTFMDRAADEGGKTYWLSQLSSGAMTREDVFNGFINSPEWANICLEAGIVSGGTGVPTITVEPSEAVTAFATRLYTTCLGREADSEGVTWWATELANMRRTGTTAAEGFFFSDEYVNANHNDAEFVTALYSTFMDRTYDQAGYDYWMGELSSGCTRESVLERFAGCDEFGNICADAGIIR